MMHVFIWKADNVISGWENTQDLQHTAREKKYENMNYNGGYLWLQENSYLIYETGMTGWNMKQYSSSNQNTDENEIRLC